MSLRYFRTLFSLIVICSLMPGNCCFAQNSSSSDIVFAELGLENNTSQISYEDNFPNFFQAEQIIVLSSMVNGLVTDIAALPQDYVSKNQSLIKLDSDLVKLEILSLKDKLELSTAMTEAKIKLEFSEDNLKIIEDLYNQTIGTSRVGSAKERKEAIQQRDLAREAVKKAELEIRLLKTQLANLEKTLKFYTIFAPIDGVIVPFSNVKSMENYTFKQIRKGEIVQATNPVIAMMEIDKLRVRFKQSRTSLENVKLGQEALVYIQGFTKPERASVVYIEPTIIEAIDEFYIEVQMDNPPQKESNDDKFPFIYRPGMRVRVKLL